MNSRSRFGLVQFVAVGDGVVEDAVDLPVGGLDQRRQATAGLAVLKRPRAAQNLSSYQHYISYSQFNSSLRDNHEKILYMESFFQLSTSIHYPWVAMKTNFFIYDQRTVDLAQVPLFTRFTDH